MSKTPNDISGRTSDSRPSTAAAPGARDWGPLEPMYTLAVGAACEALFPVNTESAPDFEQTELVERTHAWVGGLPASQRKLVKLMFIGVELLAAIAGLGRRFSRRSVASRESLVRRWRASGVLPLRLLGDALKSSLQMIYLSHPAVVRYLGEYKVWRHPNDPFEIDVRGSADVTLA